MSMRIRIVVAALVGAVALLVGGAGASSAAVSGDRLGSSQQLGPGDGLVSPNGQFQFLMQTDGNAVVYGPRGATWSTGTFTPSSVLVVQTDGNVVVLAPGARPLWSTGGSAPGAALVMQDDGNLVTYAAGQATWSSSTGRIGAVGDRMGGGAQITPSQYLQSPSGAYQVVVNSDIAGLSVWGVHEPVWSAGVRGGDVLRMQTDGNLVLYTASGRALWSAGTHGNPRAVVVMQDDGNLVVYRADGRPIWASRA